jgi:hypothetical protein
LCFDYAAALDQTGLAADVRAGKIIGTATLFSIRARQPLGLLGPAPLDGELEEPLIVPEAECRDGYVPNVVYSCGSMLHGTSLIIPYAMNDRVTTVASVELEVILTALLASSDSGLTP